MRIVHLADPGKTKPGLQRGSASVSFHFNGRRHAVPLSLLPETVAGIWPSGPSRREEARRKSADSEMHPRPLPASAIMAQRWLPLGEEESCSSCFLLASCYRTHLPPTRPRSSPELEQPERASCASPVPFTHSFPDLELSPRFQASPGLTRNTRFCFPLFVPPRSLSPFPPPHDPACTRGPAFAPS